MDYIKKALYLEARRKLLKRENGHLCLALFDAYQEFFGISVRPEITENVVFGVFPEIKEFFDGNRWTLEGDCIPVSIGSAWWTPFWNEPRIRVIDLILNNR
jgi:hypothetical protein